MFHAPIRKSSAWALGAKKQKSAVIAKVPNLSFMLFFQFLSLAEMRNAFVRRPFNLNRERGIQQDVFLLSFDNFAVLSRLALVL